MKFTVKAEGFVTAISAAIDAATRGSIKDFSGGDQIKIEASSDEITASTFGGRVAVKTTISDITFDNLTYSFEKAGCVSVNAKDLMSILSSFAPDQELVFELKTKQEDGVATKELVVSMKKDAEQYQTLPCYDGSVQLPLKADNFAKTIEIKRYILLSGLERSLPACGFEKEKLIYLNVAIKAKKNFVRFSAGTGGRHIVLDFEGKEISKTNPSETVVLIPKDYIAILVKVLQTTTVDTVKICESKKSDTTPFQVCIESGPQEIIIVGLDSALKWADEQAFLDFDYETRVVIKVSDLAYASNGISATFNDQIRKAKKVHKVSVDFDDAKKILSVEAKEVMRSLRKIPIVDCISQNDKANFRCMSLFLKEVANYAKDDEYIQVEMCSTKKPVMVHTHAFSKVTKGSDIKKTDNATGITEKMSIFFATCS